MKNNERESYAPHTSTHDRFEWLYEWKNGKSFKQYSNIIIILIMMMMMIETNDNNRRIQSVIKFVICLAGFRKFLWNLESNFKHWNFLSNQIDYKRKKISSKKKQAKSKWQMFVVLDFDQLDNYLCRVCVYIYSMFSLFLFFWL